MAEPESDLGLLDGRAWPRDPYHSASPILIKLLLRLPKPDITTAADATISSISAETERYPHHVQSFLRMQSQSGNGLCPVPMAYRGEATKVQTLRTVQLAVQGPTQASHEQRTLWVPSSMRRVTGGKTREMAGWPASHPRPERADITST